MVHILNQFPYRTMKKLYTLTILTLLLLPSTYLLAQNPATDTIVPSKGDIEGQLKAIKLRKVIWNRDSAGIEPRKLPGLDTTKFSRYGDLLNDDPEYTKRSGLWRPAVQVVAENLVLNIMDRTVMHLDFAKTDIHSWKKNLRAGWPWGDGWEWDQDRFGNNFLSHPMMGSFYFSAARTNGYSFWESFPIVFAGSYMWKIFGENGTPEREDLINTTVDGELLGEVTYRLSSNILDDRTRGAERVWREIFAGLINPMRGINRLIDGKYKRHVTKEIYQKEPINVALFVGAHSVNNGTNHLLSGKTDEMVNVQLNYGNPFEQRRVKPFDFFKFKAELNFGVGRKIVDNITGYGTLLGRSYRFGNMNMFVGGFQHYDYYDTKAFELSTIGFGPGVITRVPLGKTCSLDLNLHLALVPFGGSSVGPVTDTSYFRDYRFAYGWQGKLEAALTIGKYGTASLWYNYYFIHAFDNTGKDVPPDNTLGNNYISVLRPRVAVHLYKSMSFGLEQIVYFNEHHMEPYPPSHFTQTEQRIFVMFSWEDAQRRGRYFL
jgi:hypothetical protein